MTTKVTLYELISYYEQLDNGNPVFLDDPEGAVYADKIEKEWAECDDSVVRKVIDYYSKVRGPETIYYVPRMRLLR